MRLRSFLLAVMLARFAPAQPPGAVVIGVVRDSIARAPLAGAVVQLVASDSQVHGGFTTLSDSVGHFAFRDVPEGRYTLGFFHPMLDSLGVDAPLREVVVEGGASVRADLGIPSPARIRAAICGADVTADRGAIVVGVVRNARDLVPAENVSVVGEWLEYSFGAKRLGRRIARTSVRTSANGWFALCDVPSAGMLTLRASRGADSTDYIEVQVPAEGFVRRELYFGATRSLAIGDSMARPDSLRADRRVRDGRLSGTVIAYDDGHPLAGARVGIVGGAQVRANENGEWTIVDAPIGSHMLEVRAVGYYPERRGVHVLSGAPPVHVVLSTLTSVLDTVRITAARLNGRDRTGFEERRRQKGGHFLSAEDVVRRRPSVASELFKTVPGMRLEPDHEGYETRIVMRGEMNTWCSPLLYLDGLRLGTMTTDELDTWVRPHNIKGIEVYSEHSIPQSFSEGMASCGIVIIWTR